MIFTNLAKKYVLDYLNPVQPQRFIVHRLILCTSGIEPTQFTESLDELVEIDSNHDTGLPIDGWPAIVNPSKITDDGTIQWRLGWVVRKVDPGDIAWLVLTDKHRHVLGYMDVGGVFVAPKNKIGELEYREINIQPFGDMSY